MIILGITGGSGCGKTTVSDMVRKSGAEVIDTDIVARMIVEPGKPALEEIKKSFGSEYIKGNGELDRKKTANLVFSDSEKLCELNGITHKYIKKYINEYIDSYKGNIIGIDGAVLIESGINKMCDYLISVLADKAVRTERIMIRDGITREEAEKRINSQKNNEFYIENSDYIVYNNNDKESLAAEVGKILSEIGKERGTDS